MSNVRVLTAEVLCLLIMAAAVSAHSVTGQITGTVTDHTGGVVQGAAVRLTHDSTQQTRTFTIESSGTFVFTNLVPGDYSLHISMPGFKAYELRGINVTALERVDLHDIKLVVGDVSTTVEVQGEATHVATSSSDRSVTIGSSQIDRTPTRGRNPLALIMALPGVQSVGGYDFRGWSGGGIPAVNGGRTGQVHLNLDVVASQDSGNLNP